MGPLDAPWKSFRSSDIADADLMQRPREPQKHPRDSLKPSGPMKFPLESPENVHNSLKNNLIEILGNFIIGDTVYIGEGHSTVTV